MTRTLHESGSDAPAAECSSASCAASAAAAAGTSVRTRMRFASPPEKVWRGLMFYEQLDERPTLLLRLLLPVPVRTERSEAVVGQTVRCDYESGHLLKRVTQLDEGRHYGFEVVEQALDIGGLRLSGGCYELARVPDGGTDVTVTTRYVGLRRPRWLWEPIEAAVCHAFHRHLLGAMRRAVDAAG